MSTQANDIHNNNHEYQYNNIYDNAIQNANVSDDAHSNNVLSSSNGSQNHATILLSGQDTSEIKAFANSTNCHTISNTDASLNVQKDVTDNTVALSNFSNDSHTINGIHQSPDSNANTSATTLDLLYNLGSAAFSSSRAMQANIDSTFNNNDNYNQPLLSFFDDWPDFPSDEDEIYPEPNNRAANIVQQRRKRADVIARRTRAHYKLDNIPLEQLERNLPNIDMDDDQDPSTYPFSNTYASQNPFQSLSFLSPSHNVYGNSSNSMLISPSPPIPAPLSASNICTPEQLRQLALQCNKALHCLNTLQSALHESDRSSISSSGSTTETTQRSSKSTSQHPIPSEEIENVNSKVMSMAEELRNALKRFPQDVNGTCDVAQTWRQQILRLTPKELQKYSKKSSFLPAEDNLLLLAMKRVGNERSIQTFTWKDIISRYLPSKHEREIRNRLYNLRRKSGTQSYPHFSAENVDVLHLPVQRSIGGVARRLTEEELSLIEKGRQMYTKNVWSSIAHNLLPSWDRRKLRRAYMKHCKHNFEEYDHLDVPPENANDDYDVVDDDTEDILEIEQEFTHEEEIEQTEISSPRRKRVRMDSAGNRDVRTNEESETMNISETHNNPLRENITTSSNEANAVHSSPKNLSWSQSQDRLLLYAARSHGPDLLQWPIPAVYKLLESINNDNTAISVSSHVSSDSSDSSITGRTLTDLMSRLSYLYEHLLRQFR